MAARNIIRFLKSAKISFSELDNNAAGACEFYRHMTARKTHAINPKCKVLFEPVLSGTIPTIDLQFS
ncbi:unnamed protein product [Albugo candida]|uniref:Ribosomal protein/NADH dehydrogenase domain-containing protein n=1 Tax=Albugo candida TaxID=65357 RepID=A0A024G104_9STRA|nr:unnamed protein product [Albugo candida]|eukprot:CCI39990.1 unnamed protein product [Albugo candida]